MLRNKKVCFFCASSNNIDNIYFDYSKKIALLLAKEQTDLVFGGGTIGIMGKIARVYETENREIISVIPEKLNKKGIVFENSTKIIETKTMHERKKTMDKLSDCFITLPGGFGTLDELLEVITLKQLGYHNKPIAIFNINNFFDPLIKQFNLLFKDSFSDTIHKDIYFISSNQHEIFEYLQNNLKL